MFLVTFLAYYIFVLKTNLSNINMTIPPLFWFPLTCSIFFYLFSLSLYVSSKMKWVSCMQHIVRSYFFIHPVTVSILFGKYNHLYLEWLLICKYLLLPSNYFPSVSFVSLLFFLLCFYFSWCKLVIFNGDMLCLLQLCFVILL